MFDFGDDPVGLWVVIAIIVACILVGAFTGSIYAGQIGAVAGGIAGAFVGGGIFYAINRAFDAAIRNFTYFGPAILIIGAAIWLYIKFF